jgi:hypothetical protein
LVFEKGIQTTIAVGGMIASDRRRWDAKPLISRKYQ